MSGGDISGGDGGRESGNESSSSSDGREDDGVGQRQRSTRRHKHRHSRSPRAPPSPPSSALSGRTPVERAEFAGSRLVAPHVDVSDGDRESDTARDAPVAGESKRTKKKKAKGVTVPPSWLRVMGSIETGKGSTLPLRHVQIVVWEILSAMWRTDRSEGLDASMELSAFVLEYFFYHYGTKASSFVAAAWREEAQGLGSAYARIRPHVRYLATAIGFCVPEFAPERAGSCI